MTMRERLRQLLHKFHGIGWPAWLFALGLVADLVTTGLLFSAYGSEVEIHPVIHLVGGFAGPWTTAVLGKLGQVAGLMVIALFLEQRGLRIVMAVAGSVYLLAATANLAQYLMA